MTATIATFILLIIYSSFSVVLAFTILALNRKSLIYIFVFFFLQVFYVLSPAIAIFNIYIEYLRLVVGPIKVILTPLIFFHIKELTNAKNKITIKESLHFIPAVFVSIISLIIYFEYPDWKLLNAADFYKMYVEGNFQFSFLIILTRVIVFFQGIFYALKLYNLFKRSDFALRQFVSDLSQENMFWIRTTAILVGIRSLANGVELFGAYSIRPVFGIYYIFLIGFSFYIFFQALVQPDNSFVGITIPKMTNPLAIENPEELKAELMILDVFKTKRLFLRSELTLQEASDELSVPKYRLTQLIKEGGYNNFYAFVNEHRIDFSKELLINLPKNLSLDSVVFDSGFQSKSTFYRVFKEATGLTPKEFKEKNS